MYHQGHYAECAGVQFVGTDGSLLDNLPTEIMDPSAGMMLDSLALGLHQQQESKAGGGAGASAGGGYSDADFKAEMGERSDRVLTDESRAGVTDDDVEQDHNNDHSANDAVVGGGIFSTRRIGKLDEGGRGEHDATSSLTVNALHDHAHELAEAGGDASSPSGPSAAKRRRTDGASVADKAKARCYFITLGSSS